MAPQGQDLISSTLGMEQQNVKLYQVISTIYVNEH